MVRLNNALEETNTPYVDAYLRNLHDLRVDAECTLLDIIDFFISDQNIPGQVFEKEQEYLQSLARRYKKRPFSLSENNEEKIHFVLARLITKTRKYVGYCLGDLIDALHQHSELIGEIHIPPSIAQPTARIAEEYSKDIPQAYAQQLRVDTQEPKSYSGTHIPARKKYVDAFQIYTHVLCRIKSAIDFEILNLYDFLLEIDIDMIHSDALCEIIEDITRIAQQQYCKHVANIPVRPSSNNSRRVDVFMNEWASNIRRALECRLLLAKDLMRYLDTHATKQQQKLIAGCPVITALLEDTYEQLGVQPIQTHIL